jgi:hypothetical protein
MGTRRKPGGVSHYDLVIHIKKYLKETQIFHHAKIQSSKNTLKETKILQIITL